MIEAILWCLSGPLLAVQTGSDTGPVGNRSDRHSPHAAWRCMGEDAWISIAVRNDTDWRALCSIVSGLDPALDFSARTTRAAEIDAVLSAWAQAQDAGEAEAALRGAGVPASALASSIDLVGSFHLRARGFWDPLNDAVIPGLPWRASFGRAIGPAPDLGQHTEDVLASLSGSVESHI
jgi:crotonobetainyl-CoA:carnitine CoA-transferase CaiB-like acyl-CoA transferase